MAAVIQLTTTNGASVDANAETGVTFGRDDLQISVAPIPKPAAAGTNRSWYKSLSTKVASGGGATSLLNRKVRFASAPPVGVTGWFLTASPAAYTQASGANAPADDGAANDSTPALYTALTTAFQVYDAAIAACVNATKNGKFAQIAIGISNLFVLGAGSAALPNIEMSYDEQ